MSTEAVRGSVGLAEIETSLRAQGLTLRGGFVCEADDEVPSQPDGRESRTLILIGNQGDGFWPVFQASPEAA